MAFRPQAIGALRLYGATTAAERDAMLQQYAHRNDYELDISIRTRSVLFGSRPPTKQDTGAQPSAACIRRD